MEFRDLALCHGVWNSTLQSFKHAGIARKSNKWIILVSFFSGGLALERGEALDKLDDSG